MLGSTILTAFNDNAAITYLAAQVSDIEFAAKQAVVAGAVVGGGLTVIANAPNPAGQSILGKHFGGSISPGKLAAGAIIPTIICFLCMSILPSVGSKKDPALKADHGAHGDSAHHEDKPDHDEPHSEDSH